ncbi:MULTISPECIES: hypothetical protein [unclassified Lentimonas]|nr:MULTISPECIES: hypothetical protein [unclassified Lentimonas]CAA6693726.1 Unannotated [Lentimonas sp. CC10]CAA6696376.1 Unannotated [Lentimonas sp. CC19]CAA7071645.1 Unannotated [Lentimonas sp. CC11]
MKKALVVLLVVFALGLGVLSVGKFNGFDFSGYTYLHETNPLFH